MALAPHCKTIELAKERDSYVSEIVKSMENNKPSHKRLFQLLPKYKRRRAMSYNVHKIPKSIRASVESDVIIANEAKQKNKPSGRKNTAFRPHGTEQAAHRNEKSRWLETHLWHAKRFFIEDMWGYKIPTAPTMKSTRSIIKLTKEGSVIRDISYHCIISVRGEKSHLEAFIASMIKPDSYIESDLKTLFHVDIHHPMQFPCSPIGPVDMFWVSESQLWIITHPLLKNEVVESFSKSFEVEVIEGELNIFEIFGPKSTEMIRSVLQPTTDCSQNLMAVLKDLPDPSNVMPGFSIAYNAYDPRTITVTEHNENTFVGKKDHDSPICDSVLFRDRSISFPNDDEFNRKRSKLLFPKAELPSGSIPVIIMNYHTYCQQGYGSKWLVFLPFGCGSTVFQKFVHMGSRPVGLEAHNLILHESNEFSFPQDRPDTNEGLQIWLKEKFSIIEENQKRPLAKRPRLNPFFEFPPGFYISNEGENTFVRVNIEMVKRGTPSRFASILEPSKDDYARYQDVVELTGDRESIGIVSSGCNSLISGSGKGLGYMKSFKFHVHLVELEKENGFSNTKRPKGSVLVLIRELESQFLHPAWVFLLP